MEYVHIYDNFIVDKLRHSELGSNLTQIHKELKKPYYGISKKTVYKHLQKLQSQGIIEKDDGKQPREYNAKLYRLTDTTKKELDYGLFEGLKGKTDEENQQQRKRKEAFLMLLTGAALGISRLRVVNRKMESGDILQYNPIIKEYEKLEVYTQGGITNEDILELNRTGRNEFAQFQIQECIDILKKEFEIGPNSLKRIYRDNGEIGIEIINELLREFITSLAAMIGYVENRVEDIFKLGIYVRLYEKEISGREKRKRKIWRKYLRQYKEAYKWYISMFEEGGKKKFNSFHHNIEKTQTEFLSGILQEQKYNDNVRLRNEIIKKSKTKYLYDKLQHGIYEIERRDRGIIVLYHQRILCDRYEDRGKYSIKYDKYCHFVKNMPEKYRMFASKLKEMVYPDFLRKEHKHNPELVKYVNRLPVAREESN
jgi:DNA-binding PadR family transcriptional regulator